MSGMKPRSVYFLVLVVMTLVFGLSDAEAFSHEKRLINALHSNAIRRITNDAVLKNLYKSLARVRRNHHYMTDAGYGSRVQAASKIANALIARHDIFGTYGPGKKKRPSDTNGVTLL